MGQYLERYLAGECQPVWDELLAQGAAIREEPLASEAWAVAQETMRRVRHNIELLIPRLDWLGYCFGEVWDFEGPNGTASDPIFLPPPPDTARALDKLEERVGGPLPLSLRAFYLEIGGVNFIGTYPAWRYFDIDPLYVSSLADAEGSSLDSEPEPRADGLTELSLSPDSCMKYEVSGGDGYFLLVPNASIDGLFDDGRHNTTFVDYLRICFRSGGIPDLERVQHRKAIAMALAILRQDLLPI